MDGGGCACVRACAGAALEEMAHGRDIFGKVKDLRVGRMQGKQRGKERDCVELIDLRAAEEGDASLKVLVDARCCSLGAITFTSDFCATTLSNPAGSHMLTSRSFSRTQYVSCPSSNHPGKAAMYFRRRSII